MLQLQSGFGIFALLMLAWAFGEHRDRVSLRQVAIGLAVTLATAALMLKLPGAAHAFGVINDAVGVIGAATRAGTSFAFGYLGGGAAPFDLKAPGADFILAFQALPVVLVMSVLTTLLFYWKILPPIVHGMAWLLERTLGVGGAVGLSTAANVFLGMVEAPLFIRPYLAQLTRSELFLVMTGGMAGIAGTVLVLYATLLAPHLPDAAAHFVIASVLGAPAAILVSLIMVPETEPRAPAARSTIRERIAVSTHGRRGQRHRRRARTAAQHHRDADRAGGAGVSRQRAARRAAGRSAARRSRCSGCSATRWRRCAGCSACRGRRPSPPASLMGIKTVLNELIAYVELSKLAPDALDPRSRLIMLYAMCGFANFGSLGIMLGGLDRDGAGAPRRDRLARAEIDRLRHADHLPDGRGGRGDDVGRDSRSPVAATNPVAGWRDRAARSPALARAFASAKRRIIAPARRAL